MTKLAFAKFLLGVCALACVLATSVASSSGSDSSTGEQGARLYRHKYLFTLKKKTTTNCIRIVATAMKALSNYKSCKAFKTSDAIFESAIAKCDRADGTSAYVFETFDECDSAKDGTDEKTAT